MCRSKSNTAGARNIRKTPQLAGGGAVVHAPVSPPYQLTEPLKTMWCQRLRSGSYVSVKCGVCVNNWGSGSEPLDSLEWTHWTHVIQRACEPRELNDRHFRISLRRTLHRRDVFWHARLNVGLVARMVIIDVYEVKLNAKSEVANITTLLKLQSW